MASTSAAAEPDAALGRIKPVLSVADRRTALVQSTALRQGAVPGADIAAAVHGPVYALVTPPTRQREQSEAQLVRLQAARANAQAPVPTRSELIQARGQWRAAWWPFSSLVDAERARVMLASRGLKAEVVEF